MPREDAIKIEGRVVEVLPNTMYRVELTNGHKVMAHVSRRMRLSETRIAVDDRVTMEMSPFDLSKGCII